MPIQTGLFHGRLPFAVTVVACSAAPATCQLHVGCGLGLPARWRASGGRFWVDAFVFEPFTDRPANLLRNEDAVSLPNRLQSVSQLVIDPERQRSSHRRHVGTVTQCVTK